MMRNSILSKRLQLSVLTSSRKRKSLLQQGFTLVELMIVIVIVGVLSAVALPNFLSQTSKAKGTECTGKATAVLKQVAAEAILSTADANTLGDTLATNETSGSDNCTITYTDIANNVAVVDAVGKGDLANKYDGNFCVNITTGKVDANTATSNATAADCS